MKGPRDLLALHGPCAAGGRVPGRLPTALSWSCCMVCSGNSAREWRTRPCGLELSALNAGWVGECDMYLVHPSFFTLNYKYLKILIFCSSALSVLQMLSPVHCDAFGGISGFQRGLYITLHTEMFSSQYLMLTKKPKLFWGMFVDKRNNLTHYLHGSQLNLVHWRSKIFLLHEIHSYAKVQGNLSQLGWAGT